MLTRSKIENRKLIPYVKGTNISAEIVWTMYRNSEYHYGKVPTIRLLANHFNIHPNQVRACIEYFEPKKKKKKTDYQKLVKKLDDVFSIFIRRRNADEKGIVKCFTCPKRAHWKYMDCSHFVGRQYYATRWDEVNCQCACKKCNGFLEGNKVVFASELDRVYGVGTHTKLTMISRNKGNYDRFALNLLINQFTEKVNQLP